MNKRARFWKRVERLMLVVIIIASFGPLALGYYHIIQSFPQKQQYTESVNKADNAEINKEIAKAKKYNRSIYASQTGNGTIDQALLDQYDDILDIGTSSIMGEIKIPSIDVDMDIYHGHSDKVLQSGAGHWQVSSLPVGGKNTRAVLEGHRGLASAELFTRLDELEKGDLFFIKLYNTKTLAYKVDDIMVILPEGEELNKLKIEEGRDLVSLATCTPYGWSTHRLIVTGHRVPYHKGMENDVNKKMPSLRELAFWLLRILVLLMLLAGIVRYIRNKKKTKKKEEGEK